MVTDPQLLQFQKYQTYLKNMTCFAEDPEERTNLAEDPSQAWRVMAMKVREEG